MNGLKNMTDRILSDAREEAAAILKRAQDECGEIAARYEAQADEIRERLSLEAEAKGADMIARAKSSAAMQKRNLLLRQQGDLIDGVFTDAEAWVLSLTSDKYADVLGGLLASALHELYTTQAQNQALYGEEEEDSEAPCEVLLNKKDRDSIGDAVIATARKKLIGKLPESQLEKLILSKDTVRIKGGVILRRGDVELNSSFETVFAQLRRELEGEIAQVLFEVRGSRI